MFSIPLIYEIAYKFTYGSFEGLIVNTKNNLVYRIKEWDGHCYIPRYDNITDKYGDSDSCVEFIGWGNDLPDHENNCWELLVTKSDNFDGTWDIDLELPNFVHFGKNRNYGDCRKIVELLQTVPDNHIGPFLFDSSYSKFEIKFNYDKNYPYVYKVKSRVSPEVIILEADPTVADVSDHYQYVVVDTKTKQFLFRDDDYVSILQTLNNPNQHYCNEDIDTRTEELIKNLKV